MENIDPGKIEKSVLFRFSLYGFLKNQKYFEPFFILALNGDKGLSFLQIGFLFSFRELFINLMEIPSGALADLYGRRACMIISSLSYTVSFLMFAFSGELWQFYAAMLLFSIGEAFRTGTHKAMIFEYLRKRDCPEQKLAVYGFTRSYSKIGAALSALIAAGLVFYKGRYSDIFWLCSIPYMINVINFMGYPKEVEGEKHKESFKDSNVMLHMCSALKESWHNKRQRQLLLESGGFEGVFKIAKDYIQPAIAAMAIGLPFLVGLSHEKRTAVLIGISYSLIYFLSGVISRKVHKVTQACGNEEKAASMIWLFALVLYGSLMPAVALNLFYVATVLFFILYLIENWWRPLLVSRLSASSQPHHAATTLSIESQMKSVVAMIVAPLMGFCVDNFGLWSVGAIGFLAALYFIICRVNK